jgi:hypothetical protein
MNLAAMKQVIIDTTKGARGGNVPSCLIALAIVYLADSLYEVIKVYLRSK